jgi:hypothetical protein
MVINGAVFSLIVDHSFGPKVNSLGFVMEERLPLHGDLSYLGNTAGVR